MVNEQLLVKTLPDLTLDASDVRCSHNPERKLIINAPTRNNGETGATRVTIEFYDETQPHAEHRYATM
jgi:hypothetical protein